MIEEFQKQAAALGYRNWTAIQRAVYAPLKNGENVVGIAPTGSGKTVAFTLPLLEKIDPADDLAVIVLEPSAELAMQTQKTMLAWGSLLDLNVQGVVGGANIKRQIERLKDRPNVIVGTTGRVMNLIDLGKLKLNTVQSIIIDEADNLLSEETLPEVRQLVDMAPQNVQLGFFSATQNDILKHVDRWFNQNMVTFDVSDIDDTQGQVKHGLLQVSNAKKELMLMRFLHDKAFQGLVFFGQLNTLQRVSGYLRHQHVREFAKLTSEQSQTSRQNALRDFRKGKIRLLLTTDVAARGIDIPKLPAVVNFDLPTSTKTYTHRVGRTGRMHQDGVVINMGDDHDLRKLKQLVGQNFDLQNIYFAGNQLSDTKPATPVKEPEASVAAGTSPEVQSGIKVRDPQKPAKARLQQSQPKQHHKKNKHSKRKGMRHKRTK